MKKSFLIIKFIIIIPIIIIGFLFFGKYINNDEYFVDNTTQQTSINNERNSVKAEDDEYLINNLNIEQTVKFGSGGSIDIRSTRAIQFDDGKILIYATRGLNNNWALYQDDGTFITNGSLAFNINDAILLSDGNVLVIGETNNWYIYSEDGTLVDSGDNGMASNIYSLSAAEGEDGIILLGNSGGNWTTLIKVGINDYEIGSSSIIANYMYTHYNIQGVIYLGNDYFVLYTYQTELMNVLYDNSTNEINVVSEIYLGPGHGGYWDGEDLSSGAQLNNGNLIFTSVKGNYSFIGVDDNHKFYRIGGKHIFNAGKDINIETIAVYEEYIFLMNNTGYYWVIDYDGELLFNGVFPGGNSQRFSGATIVNDKLVAFSKNYYYVTKPVYSFASDIVDLNETKINLLEYRDADDNQIMSGETTYSQIDAAIRESVVSTYNMPTASTYSDLKLYDENLNEVKDNEQIWISDEINFRFVSAGTAENIIGQTDIITVDLEFPVVIRSNVNTDISQSRVQIDYEIFAPVTNPLVSVSVVSNDGNVITTQMPTADVDDSSIYKDRIIIDGLEKNVLYDGYYLQIKYKENEDSVLSKKTTSDLDGSIIKPVKVIQEDLVIKDDKIIAKTNIDGNWYSYDSVNQKVIINIEFGVYDDGNIEYVPSKTKSTIKSVDQYGVVIEQEVLFDPLMYDDENTVVQEVYSTIEFKYIEGATYTNLKLALDGNMANAISVPVYNEDGDVVILSREPEVQKNPNHFIFMIVAISLLILSVIIAIVASIVIYAKHHFHH